MIDRLKNEPVVIAEFAKVAVAFAVVFGFSLDAETATLIVGLIYAALTFAARQFVRPVSNDETTGSG